jgi:hypothetical protein
MSYRRWAREKGKFWKIRRNSRSKHYVNPQ